MNEKLSPLIPVGAGAVVTNDWCISCLLTVVFLKLGKVVAA